MVLKSLKELISQADARAIAAEAELTSAVANVDTRVTAIIGENPDVADTIAANADKIAANQALLADLQIQADGTSATLTAATGSFTASIQSLETSHTALSATVETNRLASVSADATLTANLNQEITDRGAGDLAEKNRAEAAEIALGARIDTEESARATAVTAVDNARLSDKAEATAARQVIVGDLNSEVSARAAGDLAEKARAEAVESSISASLELEINTRAAEISAANGARSAGDKKMAFSHISEFDGLLAVGDYPFSYGAGIPSAEGFGISIPCRYKFVGYGIKSIKQANYGFSLTIEGYEAGASVPAWSQVAAVPAADGYLYHKQAGDYTAKNAGEVCIKVSALDEGAAVDVGDRFRVTLYFQSWDVFQ